MAKQDNREWRVKGVGIILKEETKSLTKNLGVSVSDFVKTIVAEKVKSYPEHMKLPPKTD